MTKRSSEQVLTTAPASVSVSGLQCQAPGANAEYSLQDVSVNGKAQYATADGVWHLYASFVSGSGAIVPTPGNMHPNPSMCPCFGSIADIPISRSR